jgi:uridine kinase
MRLDFACIKRRKEREMAELELSALKEILKDPEGAVTAAEEDYRNKINGVAELIVKSGKIRVILLAGPSGSGKTTTANLLCDRIKSRGERSMVVSMDDFYMNVADPAYPILEDGTPDFESPYALDVAELLSTLENIVNGKPFSVPKYDFKAGSRAGACRYEGFADGCVIMEGIHGLNPMFSSPFSKDSILKLFVSVSTNINVNGVRIISGKKMRFVRRMVRDSIYRGTGAERTLDMWKNVLMGEEIYLYPYKEQADVKLDTFHVFEPAAMKPYAMKLLNDEVVKKSPYAKVVRGALAEIPEYDSSIIPETSLIKEFIPGGIYEHLY